MDQPLSPVVDDRLCERWGRALLVVALVSAAVLMSPVWFADPLSIDEHGSYWIIDSGRPLDVWDRCVTIAATPPLYSWVQQATLSLGGRTEWMIRLPGLIGTVAGVGLIYFVGRSLQSPVTGGLAALILAWHPGVVDQVRIGRCYGLLHVLTVSLLLATLSWRKLPTSLARTALWGAIAAAILWTHYVAAPLIAACWLSVLWQRPTGRHSLGQSVVAAILGGVIVLALAAPLTPVIQRVQDWGPYLNFQTTTPPLTAFFGPIWWIGVPLALIARCVSGWARPVGRDESLTPTLVLLLLWSAAPLLGMTVLGMTQLSSFGNPRYLLPYAPGTALLLAVCLPRTRPWISTVLALVLLVGSWSWADYRPWQLIRIGDPGATDWQTIAAIVERDGQAGEPLFVQSGLIEAHLVPVLAQEPLFHEYLSCRAGRFYLPTPHPRYGLPFRWDIAGVPEQYLDFIAAEVANGQRVQWVASATDSDLCRNSADGIGQLLTPSGFERRRRHEFPTAILELWERRR